jgi:hypothetical protein
VRSRLREIAKPNADFDRHGSVDAMHLATCSDEEFAGLLALLDWLGPLPAAETSAAI